MTIKFEKYIMVQKKLQILFLKLFYLVVEKIEISNQSIDNLLELEVFIKTHSALLIVS